MKNILLVLVIIVSAQQLAAQTNEPPRLAIVAITDETAAVADVLMAELSSHKNLQLLERNEIEKAYREQGLSAGNKDYLKLGQILGADGLLLLDAVRTPQATNLMARFIAVKPGVILTDGSFDWPLKDTAQWAESVSSYLNLLLPKLLVQAKDAIPISVVNLRSAVASAEGAETERQLKLLTIQRLSQEKELFVLERQKMQLLGEEKMLRADDSAFWNGSYLLEGVVDQNGYSKDTVTINARLTPPKGGAPLQFEVSASRTNLSEVINQLAEKVNEALKINSAVKEWNAADEAAQYFNEAKWALRWGVYSEAQAAADSAWALGKQDLGCAIVRVKSYMLDILANVRALETMEESYGAEGGYDVNGKPVGNPPSEARIQSDIQKMIIEYPHGIAYKETQDEFQKSQEAKSVKYVYSSGPPDPRNIERALHALDFYYQFSRNSPDGAPKIVWRGVGWTDWHNSDWYQLGIDDLVAASTVLQRFNLDSESQKLVAEKLVELRVLARSVAGFMSQSPTVHDSYFVGDRIATHDELSHTIEENPSIFRCKVQWGSYWQETPEDGVAIYRDLMSSPVFCYIHKDFWSPELPMPRLAAWNEQDRKRIPTVWNNFIQELSGSTNVLWRMEAKALNMSDASSYEQSQTARDALFEIIRFNRAELVANNVELFYLGWGLGYPNAELDAMDQEYWLKTVPAQKTLGVFEKQKEYLKANKPYNFMEFVTVFQERNYSQAKALEIQPLITAYKSNLVAQAQTASRMQKGQLLGAIAQVGFLENDVSRVLNPPVPPPQSPNQPPPTKPASVANIVVAPPISHVAPEIVTNIITVNQFFSIPLDRLYHLSDGEKISSSGASITAHHWFEGRLLLNFRYNAYIELRDEKSALLDNRAVAGGAIGIFDPVTERWSVIDCPESDGTSHIMSQNDFYHRSVLLHGELFTCDEKQIKKYDFQNQQWDILSISDGNNYELFAVNGHLYAANQNTIFEIVNDGKETHILASARRQPPASALDTESLGTPTLFEGPEHSLRVCTSRRIYTWTGSDWREDSDAPPHESGWRADGAPQPSSNPEMFMDGILFRQTGFLSAGYQNGVIFRRENGTYGNLDSQDEIYCLSNETNVAKLCLKGDQGDWRNLSRPVTKAAQVPKLFWKMPANLLPGLPVALRQSDLYLLEDNFAVHTIINERHEILQDKGVANDAYNAALLCFSHDLPLPQRLFLKFDAPNVKAPTWMFPTTNLFFLGNSAGFWTAPVFQIDSAIAAQKQIQIVEETRETAQTVMAVKQAAEAKEQVQKGLLVKYDGNHNGIIDPDEREEALDDPAFVGLELDTIDANHNGWLDAEELTWFDASNNKILEPKEQSGIDIAQHLLTERLLKCFDANGDGWLDRSEFDSLVQASIEPNARSFMPGMQPRFPDNNHDGYVDLSELETLLKQQLRSGLRVHRMPGAAPFNQMRMDPSQPVDQRQMFKAVVEAYWQNPVGNPDHPRSNNQIPIGAGNVTNGLQPNVKP